jgi:hypothetical protein
VFAFTLTFAGALECDDPVVVPGPDPDDVPPGGVLPFALPDAFEREEPAVPPAPGAGDVPPGSVFPFAFADGLD